MATTEPIANTKNRQSVLAAQKKWLVQKGEEIGRLAEENEEWKHQIGTISEAAHHETEPEVLLNLLRYQAGRNEKTWYRPRDAHTPLEAAIKECVKHAANDPEAAMELIRHLLLYTYRAYTYYNSQIKKAKGKKKEKKKEG